MGQTVFSMRVDAQLLQQAILASNDGIIITDARLEDNPIIYVNPAFERLTGYSVDEIINQNCRFLQGDDRDQPELIILRDSVRRKVSCFVQLRNYRKDGSMFWNELSISPVRNGFGLVTHFIGILKDITERVLGEKELREKTQELEKANARLQKLAMKDGLTDVFNRHYLNEQLEKEWNRALRNGAPITLFMIDIDFFKHYNDKYGHQAGDQCLRDVAQTIQQSFRRFSESIARYGGDEFAVIAAGLNAEKARASAKHLCSAIRNLAIIHFHSPVAGYVTASIGVASVIPTRATSFDVLFDSADKALYEAKSQGRNRFVEA